MGYLKEKYTTEYYTGYDSNGEKLEYGATSCFDSDGNYILREHDFLILEQIDFNNMNVLALGCGRGEELAYAIEHKATIENMVGVDFSVSAIKIAKELIKKKKFKEPLFYAKDALDFVSEYKKIVKKNPLKKFNIIIMFDFVEHVPRKELIKILEILKYLIDEKAILVINTPAYKYDNDVIKDGYDERNQIDIYDKSDSIPETSGMHCNKYSLLSLQKFMNDQGFINLTEAHFYIIEKDSNKDIRLQSYFNRWNFCVNNKFPLSKKFVLDTIESPYPINNAVKWIQFKEGVLKDVCLLLTEEYKDIAYPKGNTDIEMMKDISLRNPVGKVIFDVGAFVGSSSLVFSKFVGVEGKVIAFEPNPFHQNRIFINLSKNLKLSQNIFTFPYALGRENGTKGMNLSSEVDRGISSTSRLLGSHSKISDANLPSGFENISVEVLKLDTFIQKRHIIPDILKVDIEGAEYDFLLGSIDTIRKYHPIFYIEIHSEFCAVRCFEILNSEGYTITIINEEPDNRIMIKAEYIDSHLKSGVNESCKDYQKDLLRLSKQIESMEIENSKYIKKNRNLIEKNSNLVILNTNLESSLSQLRFDKESEIEGFKSQLSMIKNNLSSLEKSKSWAITKPLRQSVKLIKLVQTQGLFTTMRNIFYKYIKNR